MSDYISRQKAIDAMAELQGMAASKGELTGISKAWQKIKKLPPAEPKTGKWVDDGDPLMLTCGNCGYAVMRYNSTPFCPNCGEKKEVNHESN